MSFEIETIRASLSMYDGAATCHATPKGVDRFSTPATDLDFLAPLIRRLERFGPLSEEDRAALAKVCLEARNVPGRTDLVREDEKPTGGFLVLEGFACRYKVDTHGNRQITAYLLPGEFYDVDLALLSRMDHAIATLSECRIVRIAPSDILELQQRPFLARALRIGSLLEQANSREWIVNIGSRNATKRIAHLFCELHARLDMVGLVEESTFQFPLTQSDLADTLGMSNVHMNRSIRDLKDAELITLRCHRLCILDLPRLYQCAGFRPNYLLPQGSAG